MSQFSCDRELVQNVHIYHVLMGLTQRKRIFYTTQFTFFFHLFFHIMTQFTFFFTKVNEAAQKKNEIHRIHLEAAKVFQVAEEKKIELQQRLQRSIVKSKPYFEVQREFQDKLEVRIWWRLLHFFLNLLLRDVLC